MGGSAGARHVARAALWGVAALAAIAIVPGCGAGTGSATVESAAPEVPAPAPTATTSAPTVPVATSAPVAGATSVPPGTAGERAPATTVATPGTVTVPATDGTVLPPPAPGADGVTEIAGNPDLDDWHQTAAEHRDSVGGTFRYDCPPTDDPDAYEVWGTGVYADDSSVCAAAVHAGVIGSDGGSVLITVLPGAEQHDASHAHGVTSEPAGPAPASFFFPSAPEPEPDTGSLDPWQVTVRSLGIGVGYSGTLECPGGGRTGQVWGTGVYTDHSSICTAAVHFGLISAGAGGRVTFDVLGVQPEFVGSWSHGVSSGDHPLAGPAFQFSD